MFMLLNVRAGQCPCWIVSVLDSVYATEQIDCTPLQMKKQKQFRVVNLSIDLDLHETLCLDRCKESLKKRISQVIGPSRNRYGASPEQKYCFQEFSPQGHANLSSYQMYKQSQKQSLHKMNKNGEAGSIHANILGFSPDERNRKNILLHFTNKFVEERLHAKREMQREITHQRNNRRLRNTIDVLHRSFKEECPTDINHLAKAFSVRTAVPSVRPKFHSMEGRARKCISVLQSRYNQGSEDVGSGTIEKKTIRPWSTHKRIQVKVAFDPQVVLE